MVCYMAKWRQTNINIFDFSPFRQSSTTHINSGVYFGIHRMGFKSSKQSIWWLLVSFFFCFLSMKFYSFTWYILYVKGQVRFLTLNEIDYFFWRLTTFFRFGTIKGNFRNSTTFQSYRISNSSVWLQLKLSDMIAGWWVISHFLKILKLDNYTKN